MTDATFLAALEQTPDDPLLRSVYADFLGDANRHDDADVLRADEAMRRVTVWDDAYWSAKAVRNDLRRRCDPAWLRATGCDGSRPDRYFRDGYPDGVRERWRLLRAFTEGWYGVEMPDAVGHDGEIEAEMRRTGMTFGPGLSEFVSFVLDTSPNIARHPFGPYRYRIDIHAQVSAFAVLGSGSGLYAVNLDTVGEEDPIVRYLTCYHSPLAASGYRYEVEDEGRRQTLSELVTGLCITSVPTRMEFSLPGRRDIGLLVATVPVMGGVVPSIINEWPGGFVGYYPPPDPPGGGSRICVHPLAAWSCLPPEVVRLARDASDVRLGDLTPDSLSDLLAVCGGDAPEWLPQLHQMSPDDDVPF